LELAHLFYSRVKKDNMDNKDKFPEQEAPAKNTDDAFVQVGEDGSPVIPSTEDTKTDIEKKDETTTLDKR
jgi:hypothetical protein